MKKKHQKGKINKKYELFDALCQEMEEKDYRMQDKTFSAKEAGTQGMLLPIPFIVLVVIGYFGAGERMHRHCGRLIFSCS